MELIVGLWVPEEVSVCEGVNECDGEPDKEVVCDCVGLESWLDVPVTLPVVVWLAD